MRLRDIFLVDSKSKTKNKLDDDLATLVMMGRTNITGDKSIDTNNILKSMHQKGNVQVTPNSLIGMLNKMNSVKSANTETTEFSGDNMEDEDPSLKDATKTVDKLASAGAKRFTSGR